MTIQWAKYFIYFKYITRITRGAKVVIKQELLWMEKGTV